MRQKERKSFASAVDAGLSGQPCRAPALSVVATRRRTTSPRPLLRPRPAASCVDRSTFDAAPRWCRSASGEASHAVGREALWRLRQPAA